MDENALKLIQQTAISADSIRHDQLSSSGLIALPTDHVIHDLEKYQPNRRRFRGCLLTPSLSDFISHVAFRAKLLSTDAPRGFIDADKLAVTLFFNLGNDEEPGHADDVAKLTLKPSAPYAALLAVDGRQLPQKDAIDWLEDWAENITYRTQLDGDSISRAAALGALRKITIRATSEATTSQENFTASRSAFEDVEARGAAALPGEVVFTCTPYAGLPERTFSLRLIVLTSHDKPVLVLRVRNLEAAKEAIAQDFKAALLTELADKATLTIGTFTP